MARKRGATKPKPTAAGRAGAKGGRGAADATESVAREVLSLLRTVDETVSAQADEVDAEEVPITLPELRSAADYLADAGVVISEEEEEEEAVPDHSGPAAYDELAEPAAYHEPEEPTAYDEPAVAYATSYEAPTYATPAYETSAYEATPYDEASYEEPAYEDVAAPAEDFAAAETVSQALTSPETADDYPEEEVLDDFPLAVLPIVPAGEIAEAGVQTVDAVGAPWGPGVVVTDPLEPEAGDGALDAVPTQPIEEAFDLRGALDGLGDQIVAPAGPDPGLAPLTSARSRRARRSPRQIATLEAFTDEKLLLDEREYRGLRGMVKRNLNGRRRMRLSSREQYEQELVARAKTPTRGGPRHVVVVSRKGGVGKTTTTLMLGDTLADFRGDRILAVDGNPDAGSLAYRVQRETSATVTDVLEDCDLLTCYAELRAYTSQSMTSHLEVLASDDDPRITQAMHHSDYQTLLRLVDRHYSVILVDTGTGILTPATQGLLAQADQLVIVTPAAIDGARVAAATLDWLEEHEYARLAAEAVVAINAVRHDSLVDVQEIQAHFAERARATVRIPWDPHLATGGQTDRKNLLAPTRIAYLELAAAVAEGFATPIKRRQEAKA